jgi:hypothetical protein
MTTLYKLTNARSQTYGDCAWGPGIEHTASGEGDLCSSGWLHATTDPLLAVLFDPMQGKYLHKSGARLWEAEGEVGKTDRGLKVGCTRLRTVRELPVPKITTEQRVRFAILCAREVYHDPSWLAWAEGWLSGADRSESAARSAQSAAAGEAQSAWSAWSAESAARAAQSAARAARAAQSAARAAQSAARAAESAAAWSAWSAAESKQLDLAALAHEACGVTTGEASRG